MTAIFNNVTIIYDEIVNLEKARQKAIDLFKPILTQYYPDLIADGGFITNIFNTPCNNETYFLIHSCGEPSMTEADIQFVKARLQLVHYCKSIPVNQLATIEFGSNEIPFLVDKLNG